jgi:hypothetical protein
MTTLATSVLKDPNVAKHMFYLHDKYCVVPADKTSPVIKWPGGLHMNGELVYVQSGSLDLKLKPCNICL